jgi:hypothetical protein
MSHPTADPRWEGQDSLSLPDRPAHPDPSKRAEFDDPENAPTHGIYGFRDAKHGQVSEAQLDAERAQAAQNRVDSLQAEKEALSQRAKGDSDAAKQAKDALEGVEADLKHYRDQAKRQRDDEDRPAGVRLAEAVQQGKVVPSIEDASHVEGGKGEGKRSDQLPSNAPVARRGS